MLSTSVNVNWTFIIFSVTVDETAEWYTSKFSVLFFPIFHCSRLFLYLSLRLINIFLSPKHKGLRLQIGEKVFPIDNRHTISFFLLMCPAFFKSQFLFQNYNAQLMSIFIDTPNITWNQVSLVVVFAVAPYFVYDLSDVTFILWFFFCCCFVVVCWVDVTTHRMYTLIFIQFRMPGVDDGFSRSMSFVVWKRICKLKHN